MIAKIYVIANPGRRVKDPLTMKLLAPDGEWKPASSFWNRRIRDEDCREGVPPQEAAPEPKPSRKQRTDTTKGEE